jgi:hypothetical protein
MRNIESSDIMLYDFIDLINETLKDKFVENWSYKYSRKFLKLFQLKLMSAFESKKSLKLESLFKYLVEKCNYSPDQVKSFLLDIEFTDYYPIIHGSERELNELNRKTSDAIKLKRFAKDSKRT